MMLVDLLPRQRGGIYVEQRHLVLCSKALIECASWGMYEVLRREASLSVKS